MTDMSSASSGGSQRATNDGTVAAGMDSMSPYYLHPSDGPSQVHVADCLIENNYGEWVRGTVLYAKNKFCFVDGTIPKPPANSDDFKYWVRADAMVHGWLKSSMEKDVRSSVRSARTTYERRGAVGITRDKGSCFKVDEVDGIFVGDMRSVGMEGGRIGREVGGDDGDGEGRVVFEYKLAKFPVEDDDAIFSISPLWLSSVCVATNRGPRY